MLGASSEVIPDISGRQFAVASIDAMVKVLENFIFQSEFESAHLISIERSHDYPYHLFSFLMVFMLAR
jgi:hypothetical protein